MEDRTGAQWRRTGAVARLARVRVATRAYGPALRVLAAAGRRLRRVVRDALAQLGARVRAAARGRATARAREGSGVRAGWRDPVLPTADAREQGAPLPWGEVGGSDHSGRASSRMRVSDGPRPVQSRRGMSATSIYIDETHHLTTPESIAQYAALHAHLTHQATQKEQRR